MTLRFGTDGVRGVANADLTPELVVALGRAAARVLVETAAGERPRFLIGRDTRLSGAMLVAALSAGLTSEGVDVGDVGVIPTPGVAYLSAAEGVPAAMISASHNPFPDNGIKFFAPGGLKLSDEVETRLEASLDAVLARADVDSVPPTGAAVGTVEALAGVERYVEALAASIGDRRLDGLGLVVDCGHGAAWAVAPRVLRRLGAKVEVIGDGPDGVNINQGCGSTHPDPLQKAVVRSGADAGLAFDGDADRVIAVDHLGRLVDGDHILAVCAVDRHERGLLAGDTVVVTVMANLGLRLALASHGIDVVETAVGDRYVLEAIEEGGFCLGGEQSGHVIFRELATTGDGILTGLQLLDVVVRSGRPLAALAAVMTRLPQVLHNVPVGDRNGLDAAAELWAEVEAVESALGAEGRVLVRPSGTEPVVRVMVEAPTPKEAGAAAARIVDVVERTLGPPSPR